MPAIFLIALVALVVGIVQFINRGADSVKSDTVPSATDDARVKRILPDPISPLVPKPPAVTAPAVVTTARPPAVAPEVPAVPEVHEVPEVPATPVEPARPGASALKILEEFLNAETLAARLPLIETRTPAEELATSCLAGKLSFNSIETTIQATNETESVIDCYYRVGFGLEGGEEYLQTLLVRIRGVGPPKVVVDPLLDLYGGRLAAYAAKPTDKPGYFQVILCALSLPPENWANADSKFTIKLQSDDKADSSVAVAVADKLSGIGKALNDSVITGLSWGQHKPCQVMLQWNLENPSKPYLEALDVKRFDWNP